MIEIQQEEERKVKCLLVGVPDKKNGNPEPKELQSLVQTLDMEIAGTIVLTRIEPTPAYGIGTGKAQEIVPIIRHGKEEYFYGTSRDHFPDPGHPGGCCRGLSRRCE